MDIKRKRLNLGITQKKLAEILGVDQTAVSQWELGKTMPRTDTLPKLAQVFECAIEELYDVPDIPIDILFADEQETA